MTFVLQDGLGRKMYESDPDQHFEYYSDFIRYLALKNFEFERAHFVLTLYDIPFRGCNLRGAIFRSSIGSCNFNGAELDNARFDGCQFFSTGAGALNGVRPYTYDGGYPSFRRARLNGVLFKDCTFAGNGKAGNTILSPEGRAMREAYVDMSEVDLTYTKFKNCEGLDLIYPTVNNCIID